MSNSSNDNDDKPFIAFITDKEDCIKFYLVDTVNDEMALSFKLTGTTENFVENISKHLNNHFKSVIVAVSTCSENYGYSDNVSLCQAIKDHLEALKIPYHFISDKMLLPCGMLSMANIASKEDEIVITILVKQNELYVTELKYTEKGYLIIAERKVIIYINDSAENNRKKIFADCIPKKILVIPAQSNDSTMKYLRNLLKSKKLIIFSAHVLQIYAKGCVEIDKWLNDKSFLKYYVIPLSARLMMASTRISNSLQIVVDAHDTLPLEKSIKIPRTPLDYMLILYDNSGESGTVIEVLKLQNQTHRNKITLYIDEQDFPTCSVKPIILYEINDFPEKFDKQVSSRIPVITFTDNLCIVCIKKNDKYEYLKTWKGQYGEQICINFSEEQLFFGEKAVKITKTKPSFAVYDLLKIMSIPVDKIVTNEAWTFTITKDSDHPVLLEFDNFDGTKKAASPAFLIALIFKEIRKRIKKEIGEKPKKLAFWICKDQYSEEEIERIKAQLVEASLLLKITCEFVEI